MIGGVIMEIKFELGKGLFCNEKLICNFEPLLKKVTYETNLSGETSIKYHISVRKIDGTVSREVAVASPLNLDYFNLFGVPDAMLSKSCKTILNTYIQNQFEYTPKFSIQCVNSTGLALSRPDIFIFDSTHILNKSSININCTDSIPVFPTGNYTKTQLINYIERLLDLSPGVSDVLFILELFSKIKPIFQEVDIPTDFSAAVFGPPGTYKTTLSKLINVGCDEQFKSFINTKKSDLENALKLFQGHSILVDDYHKCKQAHINDRQHDFADILARYSGFKKSAFVITTGEFIDGELSMQDRLIPIKTYPIKKEYYSSFIYELNWLSSHKDMLWTLYWDFTKEFYTKIDEFKKNFHEFKKDITFGEFRIHYNINIIKFVYKIFTCIYKDYLSSDFNEQISCVLEDIEESATKHMRIVKRISSGIDWAYELWTSLPGDELTSPHYYYDNDILYITSIGLSNILSTSLDRNVNVKEAIDDLEKKNILYQDRSKNRTVKRHGISFYAIKYFALKNYVNSINSSNL